MKKNIFLLIVLFLFNCSTFFGQELWTKITSRDVGLSQIRTRKTNPKAFMLFSLNLVQLKQLLANASLEGVQSNNNLTIQFPNSEGVISNFAVYQTKMMEEGLQAKYPTLKSYIAVGVDNPITSLRFSITDFGLHAMSITNEKGTYFIDSYTKDSSKYILYYKKNCDASSTFTCGTTVGEGKNDTLKNNFQAPLSNDGLFRQYRLTMTTDADYSQFHIAAAGVTNGTIAQKKSAVMSALVVTMTRINGVFERDLGVRMNLVENNDLLLSIGTDNFTDNNILDENIALTNSLIGFNNYDIGHIVTGGGGGIAAYACICNFDKAAGTTGSDSPVGDPFDIDYLAHEIGHQFGAGHTFNNSCGDNISTDTCVEPGSGSTIMGYAGICSPNIQDHSDAYFSVASIQEIELTLNNPNNCSNTTTSVSTTPSITPLNNYTIPFGTAFILKGSASAPNPNLLTYCWEQTDLEISVQPPSPLSNFGPNFRSLSPTYSPDRYMPNFTSVLAGNLTPEWEVIPNAARTMNFALTVRDNNLINGGQTQTASNLIEVADVGPFKITSPSIVNASYPSGISHNITWDVAGTTDNGINTATVTLLISTDNGVTFTPLVSNIPNDGSENIQFPNVESAYCRIMITADENIYYAVSANFSLGYVITTTCTTHTDNQSIPITSDNSAVLYSTRTINIPTSGIVSDVKLHAFINHAFFGDFKIDLSSPEHPNDFKMIYYGDCWDTSGAMNLTFSDAGAALNCVSSTVVQNALPHDPLSVFNGQNQQGDWTLRVYDHVEPDEGTITSWGLEICSEVATLSLESSNLFDFMIFPNPNNGVFTIQFETYSIEPITLNVFDLRGRQISTKKYLNNGVFNETINLEKVEKGIYFVTVSDGFKTGTKKIVIY